MEAIFTTLTHAVEGAPLIALGAAFVWGVLSIVLSPCHLASIPLVVGFIDRQGRSTVARAFLVSLVFSAGIFVTLAAVGAVTAALGRIWGDVGSWVNYLVAAVLLLVGLYLMDVVPMPWSSPAQVGIRRRGLVAALLLGLIFGVAVGPCTFAYMAPMLAVTLKVAAKDAAFGVLLLLVFAVGHCSIIVIAGTSTGLAQRWLDWTETSKGAVILKRICGALVILAGLYLIYKA
jgi:cytochrome c-type biogenesis protein